MVSPTSIILVNNNALDTRDIITTVTSFLDPHESIPFLITCKKYYKYLSYCAANKYTLLFRTLIRSPLKNSPQLITNYVFPESVINPERYGQFYATIATLELEQGRVVSGFEYGTVTPSTIFTEPDEKSKQEEQVCSVTNNGGFVTVWKNMKKLTRDNVVSHTKVCSDKEEVCGIIAQLGETIVLRVNKIVNNDAECRILSVDTSSIKPDGSYLDPLPDIHDRLERHTVIKSNTNYLFTHYNKSATNIYTGYHHKNGKIERQWHKQEEKSPLSWDLSDIGENVVMLEDISMTRRNIINLSNPDLELTLVVKRDAVVKLNKDFVISQEGRILTIRDAIFGYQFPKLILPPGHNLDRFNLTVTKTSVDIHMNLQCSFSKIISGFNLSLGLTPVTDTGLAPKR